MIFDDSSPAQILFRQMMMAMAEFERNNTVDRGHTGLVRKAHSGDWEPSVLHLGYDWTEVYPEDNPKAGVRRGQKVKGATRVINTEEAKVVKLIFDTYERLSRSGTAFALNEQGYRLPCKLPKLKPR
jgi:DNA invertase Pin-like site-specific DNA recombinase